MKKIATILGLFGVFSINSASGQELAPDQNPNYQVSMNKYMANKDSINATQSTTPQDTYEAYDWTEAKQARKDARQQQRNDLRRLRIENRRFCNPYRNPYYSPYNFNQPYYGPYNNGWNYWWY